MTMDINVSKGDLVISKSGRDKGKCFLVVAVENGKAKIVDGKTRKVTKPKTKNVKHLIKVLSAKFNDLVERIQKGETVGNKTVNQAIKAEKQKIQED